MLDSPLKLHPSVALRPEPFGALAYHYDNRRLIFLKHPTIVDVVKDLEQHPDLQSTLSAHGIDEQQWDQVMQVNIKGTWLTSRAVVGCMRESGEGGSIINIASLAAVFGLPYGLDYVASKAAVIGMTRGMARELGPDHIRVNAVAPSAVMTEGTAEFFGEKFEKAKTVIAANQLIPRNLETADLTGTIIYLASDASRFVTGQTHMVDGGSWFL